MWFTPSTGLILWSLGPRDISYKHQVSELSYGMLRVCNVFRSVWKNKAWYQDTISSSPIWCVYMYMYMYIRVNSNDQTLFSRTLGIMISFREIIPKWPRIVVAADDSNRGELMEYRTLANACASSKRISDVPWVGKLWKHKTGLWFQTCSIFP